MSDRKSRLDQLSKDIANQNKKKDSRIKNRAMEIEGARSDEDDNDDFIDDANGKTTAINRKKYREYQDEEEGSGSEDEAAKKKSKKNTILNYTNTTAVTSQSNKKKTAVNKQVEELDIEEMMLLAERRKKIEQEEAQLQQEALFLKEKEEEQERKRERIKAALTNSALNPETQSQKSSVSTVQSTPKQHETAKAQTAAAATTASTGSDKKISASILSAINDDMSEESNTVDSIQEVQMLIEAAKKAKLQQQQQQQQAQSQQTKSSSTANNNYTKQSSSTSAIKAGEISLNNLSISQKPKNINEYKNEEDGSIEAYVYDYYMDSVLRPDKIYAFAKVLNKTTFQYDSVVIQIDNIIRNLFFYPSSPTVTAEELQQEIQELLQKEKTNKNRKVEFVGAFVNKKYAFELDIPRGESKWYQVVCSYELETLSPDVKGKTFSHCIGTTYSSLETFLISMKVKGPAWIRFTNIRDTTSAITNRKLECRVDYSNAQSINVMDPQPPAPPMSVMCIALKTSQQVVLRGAEARKEYKKEIFNISIKHNAAVNVDIANTGELPQFKTYSFITHMDASKSIEAIAKKGALAETTKFCQSEANLLDNFLNKFNELDPDIVIAHDLYASVFDVILSRLRDRNIRKWDFLARLINIGSSEVPKFGSASMKTRQATKGRLLIDSLLSAQEFVSSIEYTIESLTKKLFDIDISRVDPKTFEQRFATLKTVNTIVDDTVQEIDQALRIMYRLQVIPLTKQLTSICGNLWIGSLQNQRAERNEMLLLHRFNELNFVYPDNFKNLPPSYKRRQKGMQVRRQYDSNEVGGEAGQENRPAKKRENKYKGGQVFEPQKGLYNEYIVLLDFNSLYPSIIQEFNVCFTTCVRQSIPLERQMAPFLGNKFNKITNNNNNKRGSAGNNNNRMEDEDAAGDAGDQDDQGEVVVPISDELPVIEEIKTIAPLPAILRFLVEQRKVVKNEIKKHKDPKTLESLDIKQKAFKLVANSMYGCLGFSSSRFYAMPLASFITAQGRMILVDSKKVVNELGFDVIYGDTDSLMVRPHTNDLLEAVKVGFTIKISVNKKYKKLQLDIDGVFKNMLLLKKKKYATLKVANWEEAYQKPGTPEKLEKEVKGIDVVRRDWCQLSRDAGHAILEIILSSPTSEEMVDEIKKYLSKLNEDINQKNIKASSYYITKRLTKRIDQYGENNLPHVAVASRMIEERNIDPQSLVNQIINYIICQSESSKQVDKAFSPQEFGSKNRSLEIDFVYYKRYQIFEPVKRLLEVIENINMSEIANLLEVTYTAYIQPEVSAESYLNTSSKRGQHLKFVPKIIIECHNCSKTSLFTGLLNESRKVEFLLNCPDCNKDVSTQILNKTTLALKQLINDFDELQMMLHDDDFEFTHSIFISSNSNQQPTLRIPNLTLNSNLLALQAMFTPSPQEESNLMQANRDMINFMRVQIDRVLARSKYNNIDLFPIFKSFGLFKI